MTCGDGVGFDVLSFDEADDSRAVHRGQDDRPGQALPVLRDGERGPLLGGLPGAVPALPGLRLRTGPTGLRGRRGVVAGVPAGAGRVPGVDLSDAVLTQTFIRLDRPLGCDKSPERRGGLSRWPQDLGHSH